MDDPRVMPRAMLVCLGLFGQRPLDVRSGVLEGRRRGEGRVRVRMRVLRRRRRVVGAVGLLVVRVLLLGRSRGLR